MSKLSVVAVILFAVGCGSRMTQFEELDQNVRYYHHHLVAQDAHRAVNYVSEDLVEDFLALHDPERNVLLMEDFSVLSIQHEGKAPEGRGPRAIVIVETQTRRDNSITIQKRRTREIWQRGFGGWRLVDETEFDSAAKEPNGFSTSKEIRGDPVRSGN